MCIMDFNVQYNEKAVTLKTLTVGGGFGSRCSWQVYVSNEMCRKANGLKQKAPSITGFVSCALRGDWKQTDGNTEG